MDRYGLRRRVKVCHYLSFQFSGPNDSALNTTPSMYAGPDAPSTSREMLSHVAWLSEEYLRTSREKVNIAQTVHDSVCVLCVIQLFSGRVYFWTIR
jgi:hypothetical protein